MRATRALTQQHGSAQHGAAEGAYAGACWQPAPRRPWQRRRPPHAAAAPGALGGGLTWASRYSTRKVMLMTKNMISWCRSIMAWPVEVAVSWKSHCHGSGESAEAVVVASRHAPTATASACAQGGTGWACRLWAGGDGSGTAPSLSTAVPLDPAPCGLAAAGAQGWGLMLQGRPWAWQGRPAPACALLRTAAHTPSLPSAQPLPQSLGPLAFAAGHPHTSRLVTHLCHPPEQAGLLLSGLGRCCGRGCHGARGRKGAESLAPQAAAGGQAAGACVERGGHARDWGAHACALACVRHSATAHRRASAIHTASRARTRAWTTPWGRP